MHPPCKRHALIALFCVILAGCTQFPDLDAAVSPEAARADYPDLVPVEQLNARIPPAATDADTFGNLEARVASLRVRAQRLRGTVIDSPNRARLQAGVPGI